VSLEEKSRCPVQVTHSSAVSFTISADVKYSKTSRIISIGRSLNVAIVHAFRRVGRAMDRSNALGGENSKSRMRLATSIARQLCASRDYSYLAEGNILMVDSCLAVEPSAIVSV
jgi:hypothetical protein